MKVLLKAKEKKGVVKAKVLIKHPMDTGRQKDKNGELIAAHHVTEVSVKYQGETVFHSEFGPGVSKDPFVKFAFSGAAGEKLNVSVIDNQGQTGLKEIVIKRARKKK